MRVNTKRAVSAKSLDALRRPDGEQQDEQAHENADPSYNRRSSNDRRDGEHAHDAEDDPPEESEPNTALGLPLRHAPNKVVLHAERHCRFARKGETQSYAFPRCERQVQGRVTSAGDMWR